MSYSIVIEGMDGARRVRRGVLPRSGEWLNLRLTKEWYWVPVLEVVHALSEEEILKGPEAGCDYAHEKSDGIIFSSLGMSVKAEVKRGDEAYKLLLPPSRWPFGGVSNSKN